MLNAEMAETTPTSDINSFMNITTTTVVATTDEVVRVAAGGGGGGGDSDLSNSQDVQDFLNNFFGEFTLKKCAQWHASHHLYFHAANVLFLIAFLSPHKSYGFFITRCTLILASIAMAMGSYLIECSLDGLIYSSTFLLVNFIYLFVLIYQMRPIYFEKEIDAVITYRFTICIYFKRCVCCCTRLKHFKILCLFLFSFFPPSIGVRCIIQATQCISTSIQNNFELHENDSIAQIPRDLRTRKGYQSR